MATKPQASKAPAAPKAPAKPKVDLPQGASQEEQENTVQEAQTERVRHDGPWVKMAPDMIERHSQAGNLVGHDPRTGEVILQDPDLVPPAVEKPGM